jgi:hypothetical protein
MIYIPSVTEVIRFTNPGAFSVVPEHLMLAAQDRGTTFHELAAAYVQKLWVPEVPSEVEGYFASFCRWSDRHVTQVLLVEEQLVHPLWRYSGTPDFVGLIRGVCSGNVLVDWKTGAQAQKSWRLQLAGYKELIEKVKGIPVDKVAWLQPHRNGREARLVPYDFSRDDFNVFLSALNVWRFYNG